VVDENLTAQIRFLFVAFSEEFVGSPVQLPVNVSARFAGIVLAVFGKLNRKAMVWALVKSSEKSLHSLTGQKVELSERFYFVSTDFCHGGKLRNDAFFVVCSLKRGTKKGDRCYQSPKQF
jgi:hypothetical protein